MSDLVFTSAVHGAPTDETIPVTIDGQKYTARAPQDHVMEELAGSLSVSAGPHEQAHAMIALIKEVFCDEDFMRLKTRMYDRNDSLRSYSQLVPAVLAICEYFAIDTSGWAMAQNPNGQPNEPAAYPPTPPHQQADFGRPMRQLPPRR